MIFKKDISSLHVPHNKNTAGCEPVKIQTPKEVILPMNMHSGSVAEPIVNVGDHVYVGQLIAREGERFSSPYTQLYRVLLPRYSAFPPLAAATLLRSALKAMERWKQIPI